MNIFMTGSTGVIGRFAAAYFEGQGHTITALVRDIEKAKNLLGYRVRLLGPTVTDEQLTQELGKSHAVINLAGSPIATRWTNQKKKRFAESRIGVTQRLVRCLDQCETPPKVLLSASAVGFYGDCGDSILTEQSSKGQGFLSELCAAWEQEAKHIETKGIRVCLLRIGIVLSREGGILKAMAPAFQMNFGGFFGSKQFVPWIHIKDLVRIMDRCLSDETLLGEINCTAPAPVRNKEFALCLQKVTNSRFLFPIPIVLVKPLLGEATVVLTQSQQAIPEKLLGKGFKFFFPDLEQAIVAEFTTDNIAFTQFKNDSPDILELRGNFQVEKHGQYQLTSTTVIDRDISEVFPFFSSAENLGLLTPRWVDFRILEIPPFIGVGAMIKYRIGLWMISIGWITRIVDWQPGKGFVDLQEKGPYRLWWHEHIFTVTPSGSVMMQDRVIYRIPFGFLGQVVHRFIIKPTLLRIFKFRNDMILFRFQNL
ncbi:TIGR01777 family protein [SAR202 cluster bacterium AD-802-E10_MRT_200m]|nr:TIGR01777 family protein [SAR202 cluster bacterium AD-802-E10_MRT_200m]